MDPDPIETLWTVEDFAAWLRITPMAARAMLRRRELPPESVVKIGRRVRLRAEVVKAWVLNRKTA
jgi:hypothetical protein